MKNTGFLRNNILQKADAETTKFGLSQKKILILLIDFQHEDYTDFRDHDVALLFIDGEVEADGVNVDFAALAETDAEDFVGNDCEIAGWGMDESKLKLLL